MPPSVSLACSVFRCCGVDIHGSVVRPEGMSAALAVPKQENRRLSVYLASNCTILFGMKSVSGLIVLEGLAPKQRDQLTSWFSPCTAHDNRTRCIGWCRRALEGTWCHSRRRCTAWEGPRSQWRGLQQQSCLRRERWNHGWGSGMIRETCWSARYGGCQGDEMRREELVLTWTGRFVLRNSSFASRGVVVVLGWR